VAAKKAESAEAKVAGVEPAATSRRGPTRRRDTE
jgi:hypothetical protein